MSLPSRYKSYFSWIFTYMNFYLLTRHNCLIQPYFCMICSFVISNKVVWRFNGESFVKQSVKVVPSVKLLFLKFCYQKRWTYIDSPEWLKHKKATINPKNNDDNCFHYALAVALNHQNIEKSPHRISKIKPFFNQYNWKEIFHHTQKTGKSLIKTIRQLILISCLYYTILKKQDFTNKSKRIFRRKNQIIFF